MGSHLARQWVVVGDAEALNLPLRLAVLLRALRDWRSAARAVAQEAPKQSTFLHSLRAQELPQPRPESSA